MDNELNKGQGSGDGKPETANNPQPTSQSQEAPPPGHIPEPRSEPQDHGGERSDLKRLLGARGMERLREVEPWPEPVDGCLLLDTLVREFQRFVVLPRWGPEAVSLFDLHTFAFHLRDVTTYLGLESPELRCGKTTLLRALSKLVNRPLALSNITSPALFRAIEQLQPVLLMDEMDTFFHGKQALRGILNAGYTPETAIVLRVVFEAADRSEPDWSSEPNGQPTREAVSGSRLVAFSCWCPKVMATIGRLQGTLADRCIVLPMQRKGPNQKCERVRKLDGTVLRRQCQRFVLDHADAIAKAEPDIPAALNDRAADIWEPLLVLADLAGGHWPDLAREAAVELSTTSQEASPIRDLLLDLMVVLDRIGGERVFSRDLVLGLVQLTREPRLWPAPADWKEMSDIWLANKLRPYGLRPRTLRIGGRQGKCYLKAEFMKVLQHYVPRSQVDAIFGHPLAEGIPPGMKG